MSQYEIDNIERLRRKAEGLLQMADGTYEGSESEAKEILEPEIFELELPKSSLREMYRLLRLNHENKK